MQNWWISWKMAQFRQAEILKEAEILRQAALWRAAQPQSGRRRGSGGLRVLRAGGTGRSLHLLYHLGSAMVRWGQALCARYELQLPASD